jgi:type IV fimbrial biogenesis protein FimT
MHAERGLTLVEVAAVLAILAILAAAAAPSLAALVQEARVQRAASELQRAVSAARHTAVAMNRTVTVALQGDRYEVVAPASGTRQAVAVLAGRFDNAVTVAPARPTLSFTSSGWLADGGFQADVHARDATCTAGACRRLLVSAGGAFRTCNPASTNEVMRCD